MGKETGIQRAIERITDYVRNGKDYIEFREMSAEEINEISRQAKELSKEAVIRTKETLRKLGYEIQF